MALRTSGRRQGRACRKRTRAQRTGGMTLVRDRFGSERPVLITGGAGFIGCNMAAAFASGGSDVLVFDSLARHVAQENAHWLKGRFGGRIDIQSGDVREQATLRAAPPLAS